MSPLDPEMRICIQELLNCYHRTSETLRHCLEYEDSEGKVVLLKTLTACSEACRSTIILILQGQYLHWDSCATTAELCTLTARHCLEFPHHPILKICAEACQRCAQACSRQSKLFYMEEVLTPPSKPFMF